MTQAADWKCLFGFSGSVTQHSIRTAKGIIANGTAPASLERIPIQTLTIMNKLSETFSRNADGSWTCRSLASLDGPNGRIQVTPGTTFAPGTTFMGVELVAWLDARAIEEDLSSKDAG